MIHPKLGQSSKYTSPKCYRVSRNLSEQIVFLHIVIKKLI